MSLELRLVDSKHEGSGVLQGRYNQEDEWGAICSNQWDIRDSPVACRHLGFLTRVWNEGAIRRKVGVEPNSTFLTAVGCYGHETQLSQCDLVSDVSFNCSSFPYIECIAGSISSIIVKSATSFH